MKNIIFRLNAGENYGLGHYYRSMSLINELKDKYTIFVIHNKSDFWENNKLSNVEYIQTEISQNLGDIGKFIIDNNIDCLFIDGNIIYDKNVWDLAKNNNCKIINYQNLTDSRFYCDSYILPSIHQEDAFFADFDKKKTKIYRGLSYFTFNEKVLKQSRKINPKTIKKIAVTTGGSDPMNVFSSLYNMLIDFNEFEFTFFYGEDYMYKKNLIHFQEIENIKIEPYGFESILDHDLIISTFGVSTYEFLALNMPIIALGHQESNALAADYLDKNTDSIISLGSIQNLKKNDLQTALRKITVSSLNKKLENASRIIDLEGNNRILNIIENE